MPNLTAPPLDSLFGVLKNRDFMIGQVAGMIGGRKDPVTLERAVGWLDRAASVLNSVGVFCFMKKTHTADGFEANQSTIDLPTDWGWPSDFVQAFDSDSNLLGNLKWVQWDLFKSLINDPSHDGVPGYLSIRSELDGTCEVWPYIAPADVDHIEIPYFARIQKISEADSELLVLPETEEALILGGEFYALRYRYAAKPNVWKPHEKIFRNSINAAIGAAARWNEQAHPSIVPDLDGTLSTQAGLELSNNRIALGTGYIRIG